jgi:hypothetical protein
MKSKREIIRTTTNCTRCFLFCFIAFLPLVEEEHVKLFSWIQLFIYSATAALWFGR